MSSKQQRAARRAGTMRGRGQPGRGGQHAGMYIIPVGGERRFNPGWCLQVDESCGPDAPKERCVSEVPLRNGAMVVLEFDRFIMDAPAEMKVVHLNGEYWDFRKENLRLVPKVSREAVSAEELEELEDEHRPSESVMGVCALDGLVGRPFRCDWSPQVDEFDDPELPQMRVKFRMPLQDGTLAAIQLDRFLVDAPVEMKVVHINGVDLDNRLPNLKLALKPPRRDLRQGDAGAELAIDADAELVFVPEEAERWKRVEAA